MLFSFKLNFFCSFPNLRLSEFFIVNLDLYFNLISFFDYLLLFIVFILFFTIKLPKEEISKISKH